ncbi:MAG TPA: Imm10 family immunity protein [Steroidobacter sp.]|uniref:Imm10 family immunity protein n=1 Tax=Steroidobacter sp. TaxID=1978227 RepID=UPI002ED982D2
MAVETYKIEEISAGVDEGCLWVSIGFSSELEKLDVLHVVCALDPGDQDLGEGHDAVYLERFDQAYSCNDGAEKILVRPATIEVTLNAKGRQDLGFSGDICFEAPDSLEGWANALGILERMSAQACGRVVSVD